MNSIKLAGRWSGLLALLMLMTGCGGRQTAGPVNVELARSTLSRVLDHWKGGGAIDALTDNPQVVAQDFDWINGFRLADYRIVGNDKPEDANWFCDVELVLSKEGESKTKTVTYIVGTDPVLTVFRKMF